MVGALALLSLCSCTLLQGDADLGEVIETSYLVDHSATVISASYGKSYLLEGNVLARYSDFDLARTRNLIVKAGHLAMSSGSHDSFEIRDRTGHIHHSLQLTPESKRHPLRFKVNKKYYFISSVAPSGSIRIDIPSHHLAQFHVTTH